MDTQESLSQVGEVKLVYTSAPNHDRRPIIRSSSDAYDVFKSTWSDQINVIEEFKIMMLDRSNRVLGISTIAKGGFSSVLVDLKVAFATALLAKSSGIILVHNHPSGNLKPSQADKSITEKFNQAGKVLDVKVYDHIIVREGDGYYSFADECML